mmetsp:Transcript_37773/g.94789  ORF Transcript_37773/g.94789 Transcript_37773/m.94789 type:complete len:226 (+) Transcript_37773:383-1060(+)
MLDVFSPPRSFLLLRLLWLVLLMLFLLLDLSLLPADRLPIRHNIRITGLLCVLPFLVLFSGAALLLVMLVLSTMLLLTIVPLGMFFLLGMVLPLGIGFSVVRMLTFGLLPLTWHVLSQHCVEAHAFLFPTRSEVFALWDFAASHHGAVIRLAIPATPVASLVFVALSHWATLAEFGCLLVFLMSIPVFLEGTDTSIPQPTAWSVGIMVIEKGFTLELPAVAEVVA